jgi:hypothetical protein
MPTALDESKFLFEWDLQNIDIFQTDISSLEFSFQGGNYSIRLHKEEGVNYGCFLYSVETLNKSGKIHYRFDLVKRMDNIVTKSSQRQSEMKLLHNGWGPLNWIDPATIRDHILKVKMWTSEYDFEYDLDNINTTIPALTFSFLFIGELILRVLLKKNEGGEKYGCSLEDLNSAISSKVSFQVDLYARMDNNRLVKSDKREFTFNNTNVSQGFEDCFDVETIRDHVLKVKVLIFKPFSDFIEKPVGFEPHGSLLFNKMAGNLSFLIGDEIVYVIHAILTSRSDYFRAMLEGSLEEAQVPMTVESNIPIHGIEVNVFKMIIEWIYTMDIKSLNDPSSPTLLIDLEKVYVAADMYLLPDLCDSIAKHLKYHLSARNFGEIHQVAKRIGSESLEKDVVQSWISKSESFNENDDQIKTMIRDFKVVEVEELKVEREDQEDGEELDGDAIIGIQRKMIAASSWEGESESKLSVVKCLASLLSVGTGTKKRKI